MTTFVEKLPIAGLQGEPTASTPKSSGLLGSLARAGASKLKEASSSLGLARASRNTRGQRERLCNAVYGPTSSAIGQRLTATEGGLADLRVDILHLVLDFEVAKVMSWSREEDRKLASSLIRQTLEHALESEALAPERVRKHLGQLNSEFGDATLKSFLKDLELWEPLYAHLQPWVAKHLALFFKTSEFEGWFDGVVKTSD